MHIIEVCILLGWFESSHVILYQHVSDKFRQFPTGSREGNEQSKWKEMRKMTTYAIYHQK
jgi:hypothetical protein